MLVMLEQLVEPFVKAGGGPQLIKAVRELIKEQAAKSQTPDLDDYLDLHHLKHTWRKINSRSSPPTEDDVIRGICRVVRDLKLPLPVSRQTTPWDQFKPGSTIVVCLGERLVSMPEVAKDVRQRVIGARDVQALTELLGFFQSDLNLDCRIQVKSIPEDLSRPRARDMLAELRSSQDCGAVCVLGSPLVNRLADALAETLFPQGNPPARFRWSFSPQPESGLLSESTVCRPNQEGIRLSVHAQGNSPTTYLRTRDDEVVSQLRSSHHTVFEDCGMLMLSCRPKEPMLILAAGHGGCGTIAAVLALREQDEIAKRLALGGTSDSSMGRNQLFEVVKVRRRKPSASTTDDLIFEREPKKGPGFRTGWRFAE
ncbi:MAG: hypothetical protein U1A77_15940 [Pirellulales bacterium]